MNKKNFRQIILWAGVAIVVIGGLLFLFQSKTKEHLDNYSQKIPREIVKKSSLKVTKIKNIGMNLDYYDPTTKTAGDFKFFPIKSKYYDRLFYDFGYVTPAENTANKIRAVNPHPSFILPLGTPVLATIDGVVIDVPKLYSNDYSVQMSEDGERSGLVFEVEHVKNPIVKVGDRVKAGQPIAEVTDFGSHNYPGYGSFDLAVFRTSSDGQPEHLCPFIYLDSAVKKEILKKIEALYVSWEKYVGDDIYKENSYSMPGCLTVDPIAG